MIRRFSVALPAPFRRATQDIRFLLKSYTVRFEPFDCLLSFCRQYASGTTLVRTLLDAHPSIILGNEVHSLKRIDEGKSWRNVVGRILINAQRFAANPVWTGYSYQLPNAAFPKQKWRTLVIGDKKAAHTTDILSDSPDLFEQLVLWSPVPVVVLQCIRNPLVLLPLYRNDNRSPCPKQHVCIFRVIIRLIGF